MHSSDRITMRTEKTVDPLRLVQWLRVMPFSGPFRALCSPFWTDEQYWFSWKTELLSLRKKSHHNAANYAWRRLSLNASIWNETSPIIEWCVSENDNDIIDLWSLLLLHIIVIEFCSNFSGFDHVLTWVAKEIERNLSKK